MAFLTLRSSLLLVPMAAILGGCAATPPPVPSDPAQMSQPQRFDHGYTDCGRMDRDGKLITVYPLQTAVTKLPDSPKYTWRCIIPEDGYVSATAAVSSHPIPASEKPGDGFIGASIKKTDSGLLLTFLAPGGSANTSGEVSVGDRVLSIKPSMGAKDVSADNLTVRQATWLLRGEPGTDVQLTILSPGSDSPKTIALTRRPVSTSDHAAFSTFFTEEQKKAAAEARKNLVIQNNSGRFMSPYTSDRVTAEWVNKALNADIGATAGSAVGAAAGAYAANKALESVPFGSLIGGMVGSSVGKNIGRSTAIESIGGWEYVRSTSDMSFRSLADMAKYLKAEFGTEPNFGDVINATSQIYPEFSAAYAAAR